VEEHLYRKFYEVETNHWWFVARQRILLDTIARRIGLTPGSKVLDVGCGTGAMLASLAQQYDAYGTDTSPLAIEFCRQRNLEHAFHCTLDTFPFPDMKFDLVLLLDVIEHVDDDAGLVVQAARYLKQGGHLLITVPAYQFLWSRHDVVNYHKRRYTRTRLRKVVGNADVNIKTVSYFNTLLFPAALVGRLTQKVLGSDTDRTLDIPSPPINSILTKIFAFERNLVGRIPLPFGLSILALAEKKL
jgi:SAM-dependent methyltransferase